MNIYRYIDIYSFIYLCIYLEHVSRPGGNIVRKRGAGGHEDTEARLLEFWCGDAEGAVLGADGEAGVLKVRADAENVCIYLYT